MSQNGLGLTIITASPWAYIREGLLSEGFLCLRCGGLIFGRAYFGGGGAYYRNSTVYCYTDGAVGPFIFLDQSVQ